MRANLQLARRAGWITGLCAALTLIGTVALTAVDRPAFGWFEGNGRGLAARCAGGGMELARTAAVSTRTATAAPVAARRSAATGSPSLGSTCRASLGFLGEASTGPALLLDRAVNEFGLAISAYQSLVHVAHAQPLSHNRTRQ